MKFLFKIILFGFIATGYAAEIIIHNPPVYRPIPDSFLELQVVQGQMKLDNSNIEKASIAYLLNGNYAGLEVTIKNSAIKDIETLTSNAVDKTLNIVINRRIVAITKVHSALGRKFLISSLPQQEALAFLDTLDYFKHHPKKPL